MIDYIMRGLATWRVAHMLVNEDGPWYILKRLREMSGILYYEDGKKASEPDNNVLTCIWCTSVWVGFILAVLPQWVSKPFALSALALMFEEWLKDGKS